MKVMSSLRFRLMAANVLVKQVVILLAAIFLVHVFDELLWRMAADELTATTSEISAAIESGVHLEQVASRGLGDARDSGDAPTHYWQLMNGGDVLARSPSLADGTLPFRLDVPAGTVSEVTGPTGNALLATVHEIHAKNNAQPSLTLVVARSANHLDDVRTDFKIAVALALGGIAALLLTSAWLQVNVGLRPAELLRSGIERVRLGSARRLDAAFPDELHPLIDEANRLLEAQETALLQARARAGDLAHGLKTPLSAVTAIAEQLQQDGNARAAGEIMKNIEMARRHLERELSRTRIATSSGLTHATSLLAAATRLSETMQHLPRGDELDWNTAISADLLLNADEADVIEILGCLLDNARMWAATRVDITARRKLPAIILTVEDDGPGVAPGDHSAILRRGIRLDESKPGTGLGLTITKDIVEAYGGNVELSAAGLGGLSVRVSLPASEVRTATGSRQAAMTADLQKQRVPHDSAPHPGFMRAPT